MKVYAKCVHPYISREGVAYSCGQCANCKKTKMMEWSIRGKHELIEQKEAVYITLTYNYKNLRRTAKKPENKYDQLGTLHQEDVQKFIKRLRRKFEGIKVRYFYVGEYGEKKWRPHYHMVIFGIHPLSITKEEYIELWGKGNVDVSEQSVTENAIQYIVGYVTKKIPNRLGGKIKYEDNGRVAPYMRTSQGMGRQWADKNRENWTQTMSIPYKKMQVSIPRYYIKRIKKQEGRTIKYTIQNGDKINPYNYKVITNPRGKYTLRILQGMAKIRSEDHKTWKKTYGGIIKNNEIEKMIIMENKIDHKRKNEIKTLYKWQKTKTDSELSKHYSYKKRDIEKEAQINESIFEKETLKKLKEIALKKEYQNTHGRYGKRYKYEQMEEIFNPENIDNQEKDFIIKGKGKPLQTSCVATV